MTAGLRLSASERASFARMAAAHGCRDVGEYVRRLHARAVRENGSAPESPGGAWPGSLVAEFYSTVLGTMMSGDCRGWLYGRALPDSVSLIMTSPPFGLVRKKSYGNEDADRYCEWFRPFAEGFRRVLKEDGSLVIDLGGAWEPGRPTRSLYHFRLLVMLVEEFGFHLCQEHYWWNPAKLPSPAEWVNVRRVRVKDAVNTLWWLSKTPWPKASNRRVLAPYSRSMRGLLRDGYDVGVRPSGHDISANFRKDNGGAVPPNLLAIPNTESNGAYLEYCRERGIGIHPARFPAKLPEYFIRMLTDRGDLVVDPFGGSCMTGAVAERLGRRWVCCDLDEEYLRGAVGRFERPSASAPVADARYEITAPCALAVDDEAAPLVADGGAARSGV